MKKAITSIVLLAIVFSFGFAQNSQNQTKTEILFENKVHNFGNLKYASEKGVHDFVFKNVSEKPIILTQVKSSCGCTTPQWSKKPIQPGESSSITVKYNTKIPGKFSKNVTVFSNADNSPVKLEISGEVTVTLSDTEKIKAANAKTIGPAAQKNLNIKKKGYSKEAAIEEAGAKAGKSEKKRKFIRSRSSEIQKRATKKSAVIKK